MMNGIANFIIQSFRYADSIYSGVKPFSTIDCLNLAVLGNYEIGSDRNILSSLTSYRSIKMLKRASILLVNCGGTKWKIGLLSL